CRDEKKRKDCDKVIHESNDVLAALEQDDGNAWTLADNYLSARKAEIESQIATKNNQLSKKPALPRFHLTTREQKVLDKLRASQRRTAAHRQRKAGDSRAGAVEQARSCRGHDRQELQAHR